MNHSSSQLLDLPAPAVAVATAARVPGADDDDSGDKGKFPDLIFVSLENWDEVWRRNQFLCDTLARRFPETKILFVGPARDVSNNLRRGRLRELRGTVAATTWTVPATPNVVVTRPLKLLPNSLAAGRWCNAGLLRQHVRRVARQLGLRAPVLWLNDHGAVSLVGRLGERAVVYDVTDDWTAFPTAAAERRLTQRRDAALCAAADAVITCSEQLFHDKQRLARHVHLIPNGVHAEHYARVLDGAGPLPPEAAAWPRPVAGYLGTVHPSRVDVDLVAAVARQLPGGRGSVVLLGPDHLPEPDRARLLALGNVFLVPAVPYARVPDYLRAFDVNLVPHVISPFTESLNPIKLWEYLAAGKPIVSTRVAGFRDYPEHVALADTALEFAAAIGRALAEESLERAWARREAAAAHSWSARVDAVVDAVRAACGERQARGGVSTL